MAQIALPRHLVTQPSDSSSIGSSLYERRNQSRDGPVELVPNPDFVFPRLAPSASGPSVSTRRASTHGTMSPLKSDPIPIQRPRSSVNALPNFTFNPGGHSEPSSSLPTPVHSPLSASPTTPSRNIGHRRGGSEFIGGDARVGAGGLMSSSPTKGDGVLPPPGLGLRPGPPAGRRGHAHRRSGAISLHDLSSIKNPPTHGVAASTGSAPVTPGAREDETGTGLSHTSHKSISQPSLRSAALEQHPLFGESGETSPKRPPSRARVGFSDRVEYIRPLSTISSETESSMSTVRGHSVSNSLSSVVSAGTSSPSSSRAARPSLITTFEGDNSKTRPRTAEPILENKAQVRRDLFIDLSPNKRPSSAVASPVTPSSSVGSPVTSRGTAKRRSFFWLDHKRAEKLSDIQMLTSSSEPSLRPTASGSPPASPNEVTAERDSDESTAGKDSEDSDKTAIKPRKVKSWTNPFTSRKIKTSGPKQKAYRPPTPPLPVTPPDGVGCPADQVFDEGGFDVDNTVTIITPTTDETPQPRLNTNVESWKPRQNSWQDDITSPVIDLDAALGPFNTPPLGPVSRQKGRGVTSTKRAMRSSALVASISITGVPAHRRTESAPALVPFELRGAMSAGPAMADVFEEEEEEDQLLRNNGTAPETLIAQDESRLEEHSNTSANMTQADAVQTHSGVSHAETEGLGISEGHGGSSSDPLSEAPQPSPRPQSSAGITPPAIADWARSNPVDVVQDHEEPRSSSLTRSSDSTVTPRLSAEHTKEPRPLLNLALPLPHPAVMTPDTFTSSSFSSPVFTNSQSPFDTPRLGTAASSVTDHPAPHGTSFGEPGPEYRVSVDDVPSLTSSRSTMTSGPRHHYYPIFGPRNPDERSSSVSSLPSVASERRYKRSSIASLSRLVGGSFGERSKLHIEQRPQSELIEPAKAAKAKKMKRLSKLMHFFKSKESYNP